MAARSDVVRSALLLLRHRSGDRTAMEELVRLWERPLLYYLRRLLPTESDAWDALQETWLRVVREQHHLRDERAFPAWLYTIARRIAWKAHATAAPAEPLPGDDGPEALACEDPADLSGFEARDVHAALSRLGRTHREVLALHFLGGFTVAEIATITNAPAGTVKSRLFHARRELRNQLDEGERR